MLAVPALALPRRIRSLRPTQPESRLVRSVVAKGRMMVQEIQIHSVRRPLHVGLTSLASFEEQLLLPVDVPRIARRRSANLRALLKIS